MPCKCILVLCKKIDFEIMLFIKPNQNIIYKYRIYSKKSFNDHIIPKYAFLIFDISLHCKIQTEKYTKN